MWSPFSCGAFLGGGVGLSEPIKVGTVRQITYVILDSCLSKASSSLPDSANGPLHKPNASPPSFTCCVPSSERVQRRVVMSPARAISACSSSGMESLKTSTSERSGYRSSPNRVRFLSFFRVVLNSCQREPRCRPRRTEPGTRIPLDIYGSSYLLPHFMLTLTSKILRVI